MQENVRRNLGLVNDRTNGMSYRELMKKYGISLSTVTQILYRYKIKKLLGKTEAI